MRSAARKQEGWREAARCDGLAEARGEPAGCSDGGAHSTDTAAVCPQLPAQAEAGAACLKVPSMSTLSPFFGAGHESSTGSQPGSGQQPAATLGRARLQQGLTSGSSLQQMLDAQVPVVAVDDRRGSPCQRAAAELMEPADFGISRREGSAGLRSTVSQTLADTFAAQEPSPGQASPPQPPSQGTSRADSAAGPIPGMHSQPDWFATMMEQAQKVGLWGGGGSGGSGSSGSEGRRPPRLPSPPSGLPSLAQSLAQTSQAGQGGKQAGTGSSVSLYEAQMAALLPPPASGGSGWAAAAAPPRAEGRGVISRETLAADDRSNQPRLAPVSLGMTSLSIQAAFSGQQQGSGGGEAGPFRPATRRRVSPGRLGSGDMLHPMLQQSRLQLSLGLAADQPIDLQSWGYGDGSACEPTETSLASGGTATVFAPDSTAADTSTEVQLGQAAALAGRSPPGSLPVSPRAPFAAGVQVPAAQLQKAHEAAAAAAAAAAAGEEQARGRVRPADCMAAGAGTSTGPEEGGSRAECLERYREKKRRRLFSKTIRYHKRKVNADKRPRVKGRFVKAADTPAAPEAEEAEGEEEAEELRFA